MGYCIMFKKLFPTKSRGGPSTGSGTSKSVADDHALADGTEVAVLASQGETIEINA